MDHAVKCSERVPNRCILPFTPDRNLGESPSRPPIVIVFGHMFLPSMDEALFYILFLFYIHLDDAFRE